MHDFVFLTVPLAAGLLLGAIFFGGLWWTVVHAMASRQPALWFFASKFLRMGLVLGGLYLVCGGRWERWLVSLSGFVLARLATSWLTRSLSPRGDARVQETGCAS